MTPVSRSIAPIAGLALLALAACQPHSASPRYATAPMYLHDIAPDRLLGQWYEVARFPDANAADCSHGVMTAARVSSGAAGESYAIQSRCRQGGQVLQISGLAQQDGQGRFQAKLAGMALPVGLWVLGTSKDGRTLLLGTPSRLGGWMLHRDRHITEAERRWAAAQFRKNGYDEAALQLVNQR